MEFLASLLVAKLLNILAVTALFLAGHLGVESYDVRIMTAYRPNLEEWGEGFSEKN